MSILLLSLLRAGLPLLLGLFLSFWWYGSGVAFVSDVIEELGLASKSSLAHIALELCFCQSHCLSPALLHHIPSSQLRLSGLRLAVLMLPRQQVLPQPLHPTLQPG